MDLSLEAPAPLIESRILLIRGQKVLLDTDLSQLYDVAIKALNQAVKRNRQRFPEDFMFQLTFEEGRSFESLRSQNVTLNRGRHRKYAPYAFTEQGIAMLSSVLSSERAILVNIAIIRTFVRLRQILATHEEISRRLEELSWRQDEQAGQIHTVFETIQHLIEAPSEGPKKRIGFPVAQDSPGFRQAL
ncbi:MAG TPA: ORF6N domain-containing protein [Bryobacteraceae bacterium]|nr:ORF6N domain-containing protein [Bryobacteraceae bacterium]